MCSGSLGNPFVDDDRFLFPFVSDVKIGGQWTSDMMAQIPRAQCAGCVGFPPLAFFLAASGCCTAFNCQRQTCALPRRERVQTSRAVLAEVAHETEERCFIRAKRDATMVSIKRAIPTGEMVITKEETKKVRRRCRSQRTVLSFRGSQRKFSSFSGKKN